MAIGQVTRKIKSSDIENALSESLDESPATPTPAGKPAGKEEKIKITFFVNKSTKEKLKAYTDAHDMTLTAGIKKAIREMLENN